MNNSDTNQAEQLSENTVMQSVILPNELRLGIYLQELTSNDVFQVEKAFFTLLELNLECSIPIPLTEEWIVKFGFSNIQYNKEIDCNIYSGWDFGSICIQYPRGIEAHIFLGNYPVAIKYVHELQNLYFALKGRELTVA